MNEHGLRSLTAVLAAAAFVLAPEAAPGQPPGVPLERGPVLLGPIEPLPGGPLLPPSGPGGPGGRVGPAGPMAAPVGGTAAAPDYWIVSSRRCAQSGRPVCPGGTYDYFHVCGAGPPRFLDEATFRAWLVPGVPVCLVVHGSFTDWRDTVEGAARIYEWLRAAAPERPLHVVFFSWPSDGHEWWLLPQVNINVLGARAEFNGFYVADLIARILPAHPVSLFGHSHGARVVMSALNLMGGGIAQGQRLAPTGDGRHFRVVLAAAALEQHWLSRGGYYACAMNRVDRLVNLRNRNDIALAFYPMQRLFAGLPLGRAGFRPLDRVQFRQLGLDVAELDVSGLLDTGHLWDNYYRRPEIAQSIAPYVYFTDACPPPAAPHGPGTFGLELLPPSEGPILPR